MYMTVSPVRFVYPLCWAANMAVNLACTSDTVVVKPDGAVTKITWHADLLVYRPAESVTHLLRRLTAILMGI